MFIKLTNSINQNPLHLNAKAISSVTTSDRMGDNGARVFITGEDAPWYVSESVEEVMDRIREAEDRERILWRFAE